MSKVSKILDKLWKAFFVTFIVLLFRKAGVNLLEEVE